MRLIIWHASDHLACASGRASRTSPSRPNRIHAHRFVPSEEYPHGCHSGRVTGTSEDLSLCKVVSLNLDSNLLAGSINQSHLEYLPYLQELVLKDNSLGGAVRRTLLCKRASLLFSARFCIPLLRQSICQPTCNGIDNGCNACNGSLLASPPLPPPHETRCPSRCRIRSASLSIRYSRYMRYFQMPHSLGEPEQFGRLRILDLSNNNFAYEPNLVSHAPN